MFQVDKDNVTMKKKMDFKVSNNLQQISLSNIDEYQLHPNIVGEFSIWIARISRPCPKSPASIPSDREDQMNARLPRWIGVRCSMTS